jgi:hypothetical protein
MARRKTPSLGNNTDPTRAYTPSRKRLYAIFKMDSFPRARRISASRGRTLMTVSPATAPTQTARAPVHPDLILSICCMSLLLVGMDATIVNIALATLTYAVIEGLHAGWGSATIVALFSTAVAAVLFLLIYEPRRIDPLLDLRFFRSVPFTSATVIAVCAFAAFAGFLFLNTLYLQQARKFSAIHTGLCTLPMALGMAAFAPISAKLLAARGTRMPLLLGGAALASSCLILTQLSLATPLPLLLVAYALFGIGLGLVNPPIAHTAVSGMPAAQAGVASAVASTSRQVGAAMGVAVARSVVAASHAQGIPFTDATHPVWWALAACGTLVALLGWLSNTPWARASVTRLNHLFLSNTSADILS